MDELEAKQLLQERLAALPDRITLTDIGAATGRTPHYVRHYWANTPDRDFPDPVGTTAAGANEFDRDDVATWCRDQGIGVQLRPSEVDDRRRDHVATAQIAERLGLKDPSAVRYHARKHPAGSADPYPEPDGDGRRYWPDVLAWHRRHEKAPRGRPGKKPTAGLTPRLQEVQHLIDAARRHGEDLSVGELAERLSVHEDSARRLLRQLEHASRRT